MLQSMVFISDPYFNEPAYEGMRGTSEGSASSLKYNSGGWVEQRWRPVACGDGVCGLGKVAAACGCAGSGVAAACASLPQAAALLLPPCCPVALRPCCKLPPHTCHCAEIWLNSIRYAMIDQLRRPRPGFEEAIRSHFRLLR